MDGEHSFIERYLELWGQSPGPGVYSVLDLWARPDIAERVESTLKKWTPEEDSPWKASDEVLALGFHAPSGPLWMVLRDGLLWSDDSGLWKSPWDPLELSATPHTLELKTEGHQVTWPLEKVDGEALLCLLERMRGAAPDFPRLDPFNTEKLTTWDETWFGDTRELWDMLLTRTPGITGLNTEWFIAIIALPIYYLGALVLSFPVTAVTFGLLLALTWGNIPWFHVITTAFTAGMLSTRLRSNDDFFISWRKGFRVRAQREATLSSALEVSARLVPWIDTKSHTQLNFRFDDDGSRWRLDAPLRGEHSMALEVVQLPDIGSIASLTLSCPETVKDSSPAQDIRWPQGLEDQPRSLHITPTRITHSARPLLSEWAQRRSGAALATLTGTFLEATVPPPHRPEATANPPLHLERSSQSDVPPVADVPHEIYALGYRADPAPSFSSARRRAWFRLAVDVLLLQSVLLGLSWWIWEDVWWTAILAIGGLLAMRFELMIPHRQPPDRRGAAPPELTLRFEGRGLHLGASTVDLEDPFDVFLTRSPKPSGDHAVVAVEIRSRNVQDRTARLRFCVHAEPSSETESLDAFMVQAPTFRSDDLQTWLWPLLRTRAAAQGQDLAWRWR